MLRIEKDSVLNDGGVSSFQPSDRGKRDTILHLLKYLVSISYDPAILRYGPGYHHEALTS